MTGNSKFSVHKESLLFRHGRGHSFHSEQGCRGCAVAEWGGGHRCRVACKLYGEIAGLCDLAFQRDIAENKTEIRIPACWGCPAPEVASEGRGPLEGDPLPLLEFLQFLFPGAESAVTREPVTSETRPCPVRLPHKSSGRGDAGHGGPLGTFSLVWSL